MTIVYQILFAIFVLAIIFCIFSIGYYSGRAREFNIRQRVCDDIKKTDSKLLRGMAKWGCICYFEAE